MSKGVSQIATMALYVGIAMAAISVTITIGQPALENMQQASSIQKAQNFMQQLDSNAQEVLSEGEGSTRTLRTRFDRGELYFDDTREKLVYELQTDAKVISPQTSKKVGNVILTSSANVKVNKTTINGVDCYLMENEHIKACIKDVGSESNQKSINTSNLLILYEFKDETGSNKKLDGNMTVEINGADTTSYGTGYTRPEEKGDYLGTGEVVATVDSDYGWKYDVSYQLPTGADFLKVDVQNFR